MYIYEMIKEFYNFGPGRRNESKSNISKSLRKEEEDVS
jgi:hypothetical protein